MALSLIQDGNVDWLCTMMRERENDKDKEKEKEREIETRFFGRPLV